MGRRVLPLITDGKIDPAWAQVGWGGFVVDDGALRTECDDRGMGMLLYKPEKFGDCQIRIVYRCEKPKSNAGVFVRIDDGVLAKVGEKSPEVHRDEKGKLSPAMIERLKEASEKHLGGWYPVHHGYEVQILDDTDALHRTGAIYSLAKAAPVPEKPQSEWRTMVITLDGERITVDVDGKRLSSFDADRGGQSASQALDRAHPRVETPDARLHRTPESRSRRRGLVQGSQRPASGSRQVKELAQDGPDRGIVEPQIHADARR